MEQAEQQPAVEKDSSKLTQAEASKPTQAEASKPTQAEASKPTQAEASKPTQAEASKPTQAEASKPTQAEASKPTQAEASKPTQAEASDSLKKRKSGWFSSVFRKQNKAPPVEKQPSAKSVVDFPYIRVLLEFSSQVPKNSLTADDMSDKVAKVVGLQADNVKAVRHLNAGVVVEILVEKGVCKDMTAVQAVKLLEKKVVSGEKTLGNVLFQELLYNVVTWPAIIDASVRVQEVLVEKNEGVDTEFARADFFFNMDFQEVYGIEQDIMGDLHSAIASGLSADVNKLWVAGLRPTNHLFEIVLDRQGGQLPLQDVVSKLSSLVESLKEEEASGEEEVFRGSKRIICWDTNSPEMFEVLKGPVPVSPQPQTDVAAVSAALVLSQDRGIAIDEFYEEEETDQEEQEHRPAPEKRAATDVWDGKRWLKMRDSFILNG
eukprot:764970-Hanusia_phi.AAC.1